MFQFFFKATLCRERYLTREEMKTQYQKAEKRKTKTHFRDSCQVHHGIN